MGSRKKSKNRERSREKPEKPSSYGPAENEKKNGGFFPMLLGMTCSLMIIIYVASLFNPADKSARATEGQSSYDALDEVLEGSSFDRFLEKANADQILGRLNELKGSSAPKLSPTRVSENEDRVRLCERLLEMDAPAKYKTFAKLEWMKAVKATYGIDFIGQMKSPDIAGKFEACFSQFLDDTDPVVYRDAHLCQLSHVLFECLKGNRSSEDVGEALVFVLDKFPDDEEVLSSIQLQFKACVEMDVNLAKDVAEEVLRANSGKDEKINRFAQYVLDNYQMINLHYDALFINRFVNGDAGLKQLEKASIILLDNPDSGDLVLGKVANVARWFERARRFDSSTRIYEAMLEASKLERRDPKTNSVLEVAGKAGLARSDLVGKKVVIEGATITGKEIIAGDFDRRVVLVVFFKPGDNFSMKVVRAVDRSAKRYAEFGSPVRVVGVPLGPEDFTKGWSGEVARSRINFLDWPDGQQPAILKTYPVSNFPHLMAIDHNGKLVRVDIDPEQYSLEIETLIDQR